MIEDLKISLSTNESYQELQRLQLEERLASRQRTKQMTQQINLFSTIQSA